MEDAATIRKKIKLKNLTEEAGCSWIQVKNKLYVDGPSHPKAREIYDELDRLASRIKKPAYFLNTELVLRDVEEGRKEQYLLQHSEKFSLFLCLISTSSPKSIRVFRNPRSCGDCHSAIKYISMETGRSIVVRYKPFPPFYGQNMLMEWLPVSRWPCFLNCPIHWVNWISVFFLFFPLILMSLEPEFDYAPSKPNNVQKCIWIWYSYCQNTKQKTSNGSCKLSAIWFMESKTVTPLPLGFSWSVRFLNTSYWCSAPLQSVPSMRRPDALYLVHWLNIQYDYCFGDFSCNASNFWLAYIFGCGDFFCFYSIKFNYASSCHLLLQHIPDCCRVDKFRKLVIEKKQEQLSWANNGLKQRGMILEVFMQWSCIRKRCICLSGRKMFSITWGIVPDVHL